MDKQQSIDQSRPFMIQETPQPAEDLDKIELQFNQELQKCEQEMDQALLNIQNINLKQIKETSLQITNKRREILSKDEYYQQRLEQIEQFLINNSVKKLIKEIKEQWTKSLTNILKNINYTFDLDIWLNEIQIQHNICSSKQTLQLLEAQSKIKQEQLQVNEQLQFHFVNNLLESFRVKLIFFYTLQDFKQYQIHQEYSQEHDELNQALNTLVYEQLKAKLPKLWSYIKGILSSFSESIQPIILEKVDSDTRENLHNIDKLLRCKIEYQKSFKEEYKIFLRDGFEFTEDINYLIYKDQLSSLQFEIDKLYSQNIIKIKLDLIKIYNQEFEQLMKNIKTSIICRPFEMFNDKNDIFNIIYYIIYYSPVNTCQELSLLKPIIKYLINLIPNDPSQETVSINKIISSNVQIYEQHRKQLLQYIKEGAAKLILKLMKYNNEEFYLIMTQLYMIISNIKVDDTNKVVEVLPFYGYLYSIRYQLLKSLNNQFPQKKLTYFFNFLDSYFENKVLYQLGTYSLAENIANNSGYKVHFKDLHQDYDILHLLRLETFKQDVDHFSKVQQKFNSALKYFKMENVKQPLPKLFHLNKISHCSQRSRNVIIACSGFTSQDEDKQIKWKELADLYPHSEIFVVEYESQTITSVFDYFKQNAVAALVIPGGKIFKAMQFIIQSVYDNPFKAAFNQAELTGIYLAHFLNKGNLFPNCSISLVGFSLGTQVIASCLNEYRKLINYSQQPSVIASVVFMGGVVDTNFIKRTHLLDVVSHRVFNCFTDKDQILKYILRLTQFFSKPIGLYAIEDDHQGVKSKIVNLDFSHQIDGHLPFMSNMASVLYNTDFRSEFLTEFKDKIIIFN